MQRLGNDLLLSATDLANFLGCRHRTALDMAVAHGARTRPYFDDPLAKILWERGLEHERQYVESLRAGALSVTDLTNAADSASRVAETLDAMRAGAGVIVQGGLRDGLWGGTPDILLRVARPSALGAWSYEVSDTKLARETRAGTILQLGLYSELLATAQGARPEYFHVVTPDVVTPRHSYRVDDYAAWFRQVRAHMMATVALHHDAVAAGNYPEPVEHCEVCHWNGVCRDKRRADDHLSLVAGITRVQRRELASRAVPTLTALAGIAVPLAFTPHRGSAETYVRVREQARLQLQSRNRTPPLHELLPVTAGEGLCRLPQPSPGDLFLDLEGDPFAREGGREYLFGVVTADGAYHSAWAFTDADERRGFAWVMDMVAAAVRDHPGMHVYHYAPYEPAAFKRLMGRHATRETELDAMLRAGRFVDLYAVVKQGLRAGVESYSIKNLEPLYDFTRAVALTDARLGLRAMEHGLESGAPERVPPAVRATVEGYNRDDCVSTLRLRDWLEQVRARLVAGGTDVPRRVLAEGDAPEQVDEKARKVEALRARLLDGIPELRADRTDAQQGRWLLAYMLDYHRREDRSAWYEYFRLIELAADDLFDEREAVAGLAFAERIDIVMSKKGKPTGSVVDRYRFPAQEMEIDAGDEMRLQDKTTLGKVVAVDRTGLTIDVRKGPRCAEVHPWAMFSFRHVSSDAMEAALYRIGAGVAAGDDQAYGVALALLESRPPALVSGAFVARPGEGEVDFAVRIAGDLGATVLAIQGPPGSGKTYCGSHMICELVRQGRTVGITGTSHKVIRNLLDAVAMRAAESGAPVRLAQKCDDDAPGQAGPVTFHADNDAALAALQCGEANVLGGTAWLWSRPEFRSAVDVLFVDEAGQMSLANVLAVSHAAGSVVLLGDPQQLEQPRKGSHPDDVDASALEHMLGTQQTIPADRGIFLPVTWRLAPSICDYTSEVFYERRLVSRPGLERQGLVGAGGVPASGLALVAVVHELNRNHSHEEIDVVAGLVARLTAPGVRWVDAEGVERQVGGADVLVVAPYNAQVSRLAERLAGTGVRVGTVDKFQGQEAPVVIYTMASSSPEDAPRGMEFLYSLNRLNVATSRARCLAILVASPRLFEPECRSPRQMRLANALCRFRELAQPVAPMG